MAAVIRRPSLACIVPAILATFATAAHAQARDLRHPTELQEVVDALRIPGPQGAEVLSPPDGEDLVLLLDRQACVNTVPHFPASRVLVNGQKARAGTNNTTLCQSAPNVVRVVKFFPPTLPR